MVDTVDASEPTVPIPGGEQAKDTELLKQIEFSRKAIDSLISFAVENGVDSSRFDHLDEVWNPYDYAILPTRILGEHRTGTTDYWGRVGISKDSVNFTTILHESIHRAANLRNLQEDEMTGAEKLLEIFRDEETPLSDSEAVYMEYLLDEGLTTWVEQLTNRVRDPNGQVPRVEPVPEDYLQPFLAMDSIVRELLGKGLDLNKIDVIMIQVALTRDYDALISEVGRFKLKEILSPYVKTLAADEDLAGVDI